MSKHERTKLVPLKKRSEEQTLESLEEVNPPEQREESVSELDLEIDCPRCHELMELHSSFDKLVYSCESCSFFLKCA